MQVWHQDWRGCLPSVVGEHRNFDRRPPPRWKDDPVIVRIHSDSQAAIGAWEKERSATPNINVVVREMALDLAEGRYRIDVMEHLPGRLNTLADVLSRLYQPGSAASVPGVLLNCRRVSPSIRDDGWWRAAGEPRR